MSTNESHVPTDRRGCSVPCVITAKDVDRAERSLVVTISSRTRDRAGDVLEPAGAELEAYRKNPVVLWAHDYRLPPIARTLWIKTDGDRLIAKPQFARTAMADEIFELYAEGFLNAWSVGFVPREAEPIVEGAAGWQRQFVGYRIARWELLEYSAVPVPANPEALTHALRGGQIRSEVLVKAFEHLLLEPGAPRAADLSDRPDPSDPKHHATPEVAGSEPERPGDLQVDVDPLEIEPAELAALVRQQTEAAIRRLRGEGL